MTARVNIRIDARAGAPIVRNYSGLENIDRNPASFVHLQYNDHKNPAYIRVSARNSHPDRAIHAFFYAMCDTAGHYLPDGKSGRTFKVCLKPAETKVIHFEEKKNNPRLVLFNALFADGR